MLTLHSGTCYKVCNDVVVPYLVRVYLLDDSTSIHLLMLYPAGNITHINICSTPFQGSTVILLDHRKQIKPNITL